jgi:hypothetical protein
MSTTLVKNVKITKHTISFDYAESNVFPRVFSHHIEDNTPANFARFRNELIGRVVAPNDGGKTLYKKMGITHFWDGTRLYL